jgi:superfamily II DNA or RNA helicase
MAEQTQIILRPHQQQMVDAVKKKLSKAGERFALAVAAVASGKSYAAATIAKDYKRVVVLQPSIELIRQNHKSFEKMGIPNVMICSKANTGSWDADVILTTANTLYKHIDDVKEPDLLIIDELHLQHWGTMRKTIMAKWTKCKVFGMTATPHYYVQETVYKNRVMYNVTTCCAIADGYFGPAVFELTREQMKELGFGADIEIKKVKITRAKGMHFDNPEIYKWIIDKHTAELKVLLKDLKNGIIYCDSITHAQHLANNVNDLRVLTGSTSAKERKQIIEDFVAGRLRFVATVGCLKIGFDKPDLENIIVLTNVNNPSNAEQQIGRLNRGSGKKTCWYNGILNTAEPIIGKKTWIELKRF